MATSSADSPNGMNAVEIDKELAKTRFQLSRYRALIGRLKQI